uniref:Histone-lysine N-methyltransferase, H3 lysine-9 specific SUVH1 n=1 Tax=Anthurium amnicola TaxID=1678845 RepID=A0A1D1XLX0_9ARAE
MERRGSHGAGSSRGSEVLDVKPLRSLSPMFPTPFGYTSVSPPGAPPFLSISPFSPFPSGLQPGQPPGFSPPFPFTAPSYPLADGTPRRKTAAGFRTPPHMDAAGVSRGTASSRGRKIKQPGRYSNYSMDGSSEEGGGPMKKKQPKPKRPRPSKTDLMMLPSALEDPKESVEVLLMTFDALRRRILQVDEAKNVSRRPDMKAGATMMDYDLRANKAKRVGSVPGIDVGDIFYFRMETLLVGLHSQSMGGIDWMVTKIGEEDETLAVSVVSSGGYDDETDDVDTLIYSGQGGKMSEKKQVDDQKLERGNLALERSSHRANEIRVTRGMKDISFPTGRIYVYDGLYKILGSWVERGKSGFNVFKYKLVRQPGQPDAFATWKLTEKWKQNPSSRGRVILPDMSSGDETIPVCLVNEVDTEKGPSLFSYSTRLKYSVPISSIPPLHSCSCQNVCVPGDAGCSCAQQNGGDLPYSSNGLLVSRKPLLYECSPSCSCSSNCRNKVAQKGIKLHFEVFRTRDRGWALRSWDPIRTGAFICEYVGEVIDKAKVEADGEEDEYLFEASHSDEKIFKWNYGPELLGEPSLANSAEASKPLPVIISAKHIGNVARFMNHSCSPNVFWQPVLHDHGDEDYPHIMFYAAKHIPPMTELTYDYGMSGRKMQRCLCGSSKCRGFYSEP